MAPLRAVRLAGVALAAVPTEPRRDWVVFRAPSALRGLVKSPARAGRRGLARAALDGSQNATRTARRRQLSAAQTA